MGNGEVEGRELEGRDVYNDEVETTPSPVYSEFDGFVDTGYVQPTYFSYIPFNPYHWNYSIFDRFHGTYLSVFIISAFLSFQVKDLALPTLLRFPDDNHHSPRPSRSQNAIISIKIMYSVLSLSLFLTAAMQQLREQAAATWARVPISTLILWPSSIDHNADTTSTVKVSL